MSRISGAFVPHGLALIESPAWRSLSREVHLLLARIEIEHMRHGGKENGGLVIPYTDLERYISGHRRMITRALRDAEALGLLEVSRGRAGKGEHKAPSKYRLTYLSTPDQKPTNEWAAIKTIDEANARLIAVKRPRKRSTWFHARTSKIVPFPG
jgi:hypothetical protein